MYRRLDPNKIVDTAERLRSRIVERFPESSLGRLGQEASIAAKETAEKIQWIQKPHVPIRTAIAFLLAVIACLVAGAATKLNAPAWPDLLTLIQVLEASLSAIFFVGASVVFLTSWETRIKRNRALKSIHELRAMAHIVDMHQLTKDPQSILDKGSVTASSPRRELSTFELGRYLDYCAELLSLLGKIAALYSQSIDDPVVLDAVDDVEDLTTELSQKVWQKILMLEKHHE